MSDTSKCRLTRRRFLATASSAAAAPLVVRSAAASPATVSAPPEPTNELLLITLQINGRRHAFALDPRTTLLDALREHAGLTGTKKGCDHGQCGACTVHVDGQRMLSCLMLATSAEGHAIATIEGIARAGGQLHPMQQAFIDRDAFQCGYCTSGQIMSAIACVKEGHAQSADQIREFMSGNLCRCSAYPNIVAAIQQASGQMER